MTALLKENIFESSAAFCQLMTRASLSALFLSTDTAGAHSGDHLLQVVSCVGSLRHDNYGSGLSVPSLHLAQISVCSQGQKLKLL